VRRTIAVTGTPLENSLTELHALLALTVPGLFPSVRRFREEYVRPIEGLRAGYTEGAGAGSAPESNAAQRAERLARLRVRMRPFVLRRTKEQVAPELPPLEEQVLSVDLSPDHRALYDVTLQRERRKLFGLLPDMDRNRFIVLRSLTLLRLLALDAALVDAEHDGVRSTKLDLLAEELVEALAEGRRALVFSQFPSYLRLVGARLEREGVPWTLLEGGTRDRDGVIERFRSGDAAVFLISLKAGGFGLNLTEADLVYLLDPWWNPAAEAQAIDRAHRIGQDKPVTVRRLVAAGTIEEKVLALQRRKQDLFDAVVDDGEPFSAALTADDVRDLLA
jgi:SNF2 family DNA or RNA helicase